MPCLLLSGKGLVKTIQFKDARYLGDPINAVRIFNEKESDELIFMDINASKENRTVDLDVVRQIGDECFMPFAVGGGIRTIESVREIFKAGAEKVVLNTIAGENPDFIAKIADTFGSQSIIVSIDVRRKMSGKYKAYILNGSKSISIDPVEFAGLVQEKGAGEILVNSIDRDGTGEGYDLDITAKIAAAVSIPVIACGGAGKLEDLKIIVKNSKVSAVAAGSMFVFHGERRAVLINYPAQKELEKLLSLN